MPDQLPPLHIGPIRLDFPVVQAALSGYSDWPARVIARRLGAPYAVAEVLLDRFVLDVTKGRKAGRHIRVTDEDHPCGAQLMGSAAEELVPAAVRLAAAGFDVIDLNFACPVRKVLGRCRGGFLLSEPAQALEILRSVRSAVPRKVPVTLKLRRGMDDSAASEAKFFTILDGALALDVAAVTVHGRTVKQRYVGPSDWTFLRRVKQHVDDRLVLGSGDLFSAVDIMRMLAETGVDGVTVARGCIGNPWIFREARALLAGQPLPEPPTVAEQGAIIRAHFELAARTYGERLAPRVMCKFGLKYSELHPMGRQVRAAFLGARCRADWQAILDAWYDPTRSWPPGLRKTGPGTLIAAGASEAGECEEADCG
jgi:tRNA-dihydrouridine synthase B